MFNIFLNELIQAWGGCYREVLLCSHPPDYDPPQDHPEHEEEQYGCSQYMDHCFDYKDPQACDTMFEVCFPKKEEEHEHEHEYEHEETEETISCVESVHYCLSEDAEEGHCLNLILYCNPGKDEEDEHEASQGCFPQLQQCFLYHHLQDCAGLVTECGALDDSSHYAHKGKLSSSYTQEECYTNSEQCLRAPEGHHHSVCISLISVCYSMQEEKKTCLGQMEVCLLEDYVDNSECHHQLQTCLLEEEEGDGEHYKEVLREEEHWAKVVRLLLAKDH